MKVLIACEFSGVVRDAFIARGCDAMSCDLLPSERPGPHYQGDVKEVLYNGWDLIIAHPPCTYLTNSGVCWLHKDVKRWPSLFDACGFFNMFLDVNCDHVCVENPIPHKYAKALLREDYSQTIQPWQFGHTESKRTCLWLKGQPKLVEINNVKTAMDLLPKHQSQRLHYVSPGPDRWKERSRTYQGIADAMADQWVEYLEGVSND